MPKINIITPFKTSGFKRQLGNVPNNYIFFENGPTTDYYDFVVVYEDLGHDVDIKCDPKNLLFISGEPPSSQTYSERFLSQFNYVISSHENIQHKNNIQSQQALPWHFGYDFLTCRYNFNYNDLAQQGVPIKKKKMSIIASGKTMMPGHNKRAKFVERLKSHFGDSIDFYGKGSNPIDDKADAISPYLMTICIENSAIKNYWTEKIADAYLGYALPVYYGCTNISEYFNPKSLVAIDLNNTEDCIKHIEYLLNNCETIYFDNLPYLKESRTRLLEEYNIYNVLVNFFEENKLALNKNPQTKFIKTNKSFPEYNINLKKLRLLRFIKKWFV